MTCVYKTSPYHDKPTTTTTNQIMENVPWDLHDSAMFAVMGEALILAVLRKVQTLAAALPRDRPSVAPMKQATKAANT